MKWKSKSKKRPVDLVYKELISEKYPGGWKTRLHKKFLLLPMRINLETRWLEVVEIKEITDLQQGGSSRIWKPLAFSDGWKYSNYRTHRI